MRKNECLIAITDELDDAQIAYVVQTGGKHLQILFTLNGRDRKCICPVSPSDRRAPRHARAYIRRVLRGIA